MRLLVALRNVVAKLVLLMQMPDFILQRYRVVLQIFEWRGHLFTWFIQVQD
jgi:hypothetical protein